tara:strand:- start:112 stop:570 length:459 start_codon:yes stop_codon:yes gene_type:complete
MATDRNNDFVLTHYLSITSQRDTTLDQVPFFLGLKNNPPVLRRLLEILMVVWTVTDVDGDYEITGDEVVLLVDASDGSTPIEVTLPDVTLNPGRFIVVKDSTGNSTSNPIIITPAGGQTIDGLGTSFSLGADYGAVLLIGGRGTQWHTLALV